MSRRIQCNTLSVKPKSDGTCGNIECETLHCKTIVCEKPTNGSRESQAITIPYSLQIGHISLGMMGTSEGDCSHQIIHSPCDFTSNKIVFTWHDWMPGYPEETLYYKVNDNSWQCVVLRESQTMIPYSEDVKENNKIVTHLYANVIEDNDSCIQSLSMDMTGKYEIKIE